MKFKNKTFNNTLWYLILNSIKMCKKKELKKLGLNDSKILQV